MNRKRILKRGLPLAAAGLLIFLVVARRGLTITPTASPDWSKGLPLGLAGLNNQAALQVDGQGRVHSVWVDPDQKLSWVMLEGARVLLSTTLNLATASPRWPRLLADPQGGFHLIFLDTQQDLERLIYVRLDKAGSVVSGPSFLSPPGIRAERAQMVLVPQGEVEVVWLGSIGGRSSLYHITLDSAGQVIWPNTLLVPDVWEMAAVSDNQGRMHLAWATFPTYNEREIWYGYFLPQGSALETATSLTRIALVTQAGQLLGAPTIGLDDEYGYVFWTVEERGRLSASYLYYASFPLSDPAGYSIERVSIPPLVEPAYAPYAGVYGYQYLAGQGETRLRGSRYSAEAHAMPGQNPELPVAFTLLPGREYQGRLRVALAIFQKGELVGYQLVNVPRGASLKPAVVADPDRNLHLVWLETRAFEDYAVYYASTAPQVKEALKGVTAWEVVDWVLGSLTSLSLVLLYLPLFFAWIIIPFFGLLLFHLFTGEGELVNLKAWIALGLAVLVYLLAVFYYPPSQEGGRFIQGVPTLGTGILAWIVASLYLWRAQTRSLFLAFLVFSSSQGFLRLAFHILTSQGYL